MRIFVYILILCNLLIPATYVVRNNFLKHKGIEIDHVLLFTFGFIFYWIFPIITGVLKFFTGNQYTLTEWHMAFDQIADYNLVIYMLCCLLFYISFISGGFAGQKIFNEQTGDHRTDFISLQLLNVLLILGIIAAALAGYTLRDHFFTGYTAAAYFKWKGSFTSSIVFILTLSFIYSTQIQGKTGKTGFWYTVFNHFVLVSFAGLVLITSMGGRTFLISGVAMLLVYRSVYFRPLRLRTFIFSIGAIAIFSLVMPLIRTGHFKLAAFFLNVPYISNAIYIFLSDPILTSWAVIHALKENMLPLLKFPVYLLSDLINIAPTFIFPGKERFILRPPPGMIYSPCGALSSFWSLALNFGIIGTVPFLFLFSFCLSSVKGKRSPLYKSMYILISGWTAFSLFRDFEVTAVKLILEFAILLPIMIALLSAFLSKFTRNEGR